MGRNKRLSSSSKASTPKRVKTLTLLDYVGKFAEFCELEADQRKSLVNTFAEEHEAEHELECLNCPLTFRSANAVFYHMEHCEQLAKTENHMVAERDYESSTRSISSSEPPSGSEYSVDSVEANAALSTYMSIMSPMCTPQIMMDLYMSYKDNIGILYSLGDHRRRVLLRRVYESCTRHEGQSAEVPCIRVEHCSQAFTSPTCLLVCLAYCSTCIRYLQYHLQECAFAAMSPVSSPDPVMTPSPVKIVKKKEKVPPKKRNTPKMTKTRKRKKSQDSVSESSDEELKFEPDNINDDY